MNSDSQSDSAADSSTPDSGGGFEGTHWSEIEALNTGDSQRRAEALTFLAERYWKPIYWFMRRSGAGEQDAEDFVQGFFLFALEKDLFAKADPKQGRLRNFLCKSAKHFLQNEWRARRAIKRMPPGGWVTIHDSRASQGVAFNPADNRTPEEDFDWAWMEGLLERAAQALAKDYRAKRMGLHFDLFVARVLNPLLRKTAPTPWADLVLRFNMNIKSLQNCVISARRQFREFVDAEIRQYAPLDAEAAEERKWLYESLGKA